MKRRAAGVRKGNASRTEPERGRAPLWLPEASVALLALGAYANSLAGGFITDDQFQILSNPIVTGVRPLWSAFTAGVWTFLGYHGNYYRPLQFIVYGLLYRAFGPHPLPFHALLCLLHALNTALVFRLSRRLGQRIRPAADPDSGRFLAACWIAAAVFALHPIHTEAVNWIAALPDVMVTTAVLAGVSLFLAEDASGAPIAMPYALRTGAHCALYFAALLSKETGAVLPLLYALLLAMVKPPLKAGRRLFLAMGGVFGVYLIVRIHALGGLAPAQQAFFRLPPVEFALSAASLLGQYLWALLWPFDLNFFHVFHPTTGLTTPLTASIVALASLGWAAMRNRERQPIVLLCLGWFAISLAPALNIAGVGQNVFAERYLYLPSVAFALACGAAAAAMPVRVAAPVAGAALVAFGAQTVARNSDWRDDFTLLQVTLRQSPDSGYIHNLMAGAWVQRDQFQKALEEQRLAVQDEPRSSVYRKNLGNILLIFDPAAAVREFQTAIALGPDTQELRADLALAQRAAQAQPSGTQNPPVMPTPGQRATPRSPGSPPR